MYISEFLGTALLVACGLSLVIWIFGSQAAQFLGGPAVRRAIAGFLFGLVGGGIAVSPVGRVSGAHINPALTFAFWLEGKIGRRDACWFAVAQFAGAALGALPLLAWGEIGTSVMYGATLPEQGEPIWIPLCGEIICTACLVATVFILGAHTSTQALTPWAMPPLYCFLVWLEAPLSGTSTNPARSFGPALLTGNWYEQWIYVVGPCLGAALVVGFLRLKVLQCHRPREARQFYFGTDRVQQG